ncbi:MAG: hypothetical protein LBP80_11755 [Treponema sp.]|nr:hypothetical protein [Treponema sp.]
MKKMKEISLAIAMTAFLGLLCLGFFAGCTDILSGPSAGTAEGGPAGTGQALIRLGPRAEGARTLMPSGVDYGTLSYTYTFSTGGWDSVSGEITKEEEPVALAAGTWNLTVEGADGGGVPVLEGIVQGIEMRGNHKPRYRSPESKDRRRNRGLPALFRQLSRYGNQGEPDGVPLGGQQAGGEPGGSRERRIPGKRQDNCGGYSFPSRGLLPHNP